MKDKALDILIENLSMKDYIFVTKWISDMEIEIEKLKKALEEKNEK